MNEDDLRATLHDEAARVDVGANSLGRIHDRLATPDRAPMRFAARSAIAVVVVAALVAAALVTFRDRDDLARVSGRASYPRRILAMTEQHQPVVLDALTGRRIEQYESRSYAAGTQVAVAPDGRDFYFVDGDGNKGCEGHSILRFGLPPSGRPGTSIADEASAPAISSDGRYLAFYRCLPGDERADELVLRELATGSEQVWRATAPDFFGERLVFESDSRHLIIEMNRDQVGSAGRHRRLNGLYRLATEAGSVLPGVEFGVAPFAFFGAIGPNGDYVGHYPNRFRPRDPDPVVIMRPIDAERPSAFSAAPEFFVPQGLESATSDPTGRHVLAVAGRTLYRWSRGDRHPTRIRDGVIAAVWIPDAPAATPPPSIAAVRTDGHVVLLDPATGATLRDVGTAFDASQVATDPVSGDLLIGVNTSDECRTEQAPHIDRFDLADGAAQRASSGRFPAVSRTGLMAYEVRCDGVTLGFTNLVTGENFRSNPLADAPSEASPNAAQVHPLAWAPSGARLLYTVFVKGLGDRYYLGRLWPAVASRGARLSKLPFDPQDSAVTFVDDRHLAVATWKNGRTDVRLVAVPHDRNGWSKGTRLFTVPGRVTHLAADASGRHLLALRFGGDLLSWTRGDGEATTVSTGIDAATWLRGG